MYSWISFTGICYTRLLKWVFNYKEIQVFCARTQRTLKTISDGRQRCQSHSHSCPVRCLQPGPFCLYPWIIAFLQRCYSCFEIGWSDPRPREPHPQTSWLAPTLCIWADYFTEVWCPQGKCESNVGIFRGNVSPTVENVLSFLSKTNFPSVGPFPSLFPSADATQSFFTLILVAVGAQLGLLCLF